MVPELKYVYVVPLISTVSPVVAIPALVAYMLHIDEISIVGCPIACPLIKRGVIRFLVTPEELVDPSLPRGKRNGCNDRFVLVVVIYIQLGNNWVDMQLK